jgi:heptosyltransferase-2
VTGFAFFILMIEKIEKILVIRLSSLGDVILTTPVLRTLKDRFPQSDIYFLTKARYGDVLKADPRISSLIELDAEGKHKGFSGFMRLVSELRLKDFDLLVDLHANLRSFLLRHLVKSRIKLKYNSQRLLRFMMVHFKSATSRVLHTVDSYLEVLGKIDVQAQDKQPRIFLSPEGVSLSEHFLLERGVVKDDIIVGVHPGAKWQTKRWDESKFNLVCKEVIRKFNCKVLLFGDSGEEKLVENVKEGLPKEGVLEATGLPLGRMMSLIKRCDCLITNDSGPMHVASALQVPVVAIFGPTHPRLGFAPVGSENAVLCAHVECSPCSLHGEKKCSKKSRFCMDLIEPGMVVEAVEGLLKENKSTWKETD